jgi:hypothetical protein
MDENALRIYPPWKEAVGIIAARVEREGYGIILTHEEFLDMFDLKIPAIATPATWRKLQFDLLQNMDNLRSTLLEDHNIFLLNIRGIGYQVLTPGEQVDIVPKIYIDKINGLIRKSIKSQMYIDADNLDDTQRQTRLRNLEKMAFLKSVSKKIRLGYEEKTKCLGSK